MKEFLVCSTVFNKQQYSILTIKSKHDLVKELDYFVKNRTNALVWSLFTEEDIEECSKISSEVASLLEELVADSKDCKIRYNGWTYEVYEISASTVIPGYWKIATNCGNRLFDPAYIEFVGA